MEPTNNDTSLRPSSVPGWMSELKGQPKVPALPPPPPPEGFADVDETCLFIDEGSVVVENANQRPRTAVYA